MGRQRLDAVASPHVPQLDVFIEGSGDEKIRLRIEVHAEDVACVAFEREGFFSLPKKNAGSGLGGGARIVLPVPLTVATSQIFTVLSSEALAR